VLDHGDGLAYAAIGVARFGTAVAAWQDSLASEARVRAAIYAAGRWRRVATLAASLARLDSVTVVGPDATAIRWRRWVPGRASFFEAGRHGFAWTVAHVLGR
jgi:hypothetical protein